MADKKITDLSQATDADSTDILMIVDGPGESSPQNKKITIQRYNDNVESLNLATSVAIILSELKVQITGK